MEKYLDIGQFIIVTILNSSLMKKCCKNFDDEDYLNFRIFNNIVINVGIFTYWKIINLASKSNKYKFILRIVFFGSCLTYILQCEFQYIFGMENSYNKRRFLFKILDFSLSIEMTVICLLESIDEANPINLVITILTIIDLILNFIEMVRNTCFFKSIESPKEKSYSNNIKALNFGLIIGFIFMTLIDFSQIYDSFQETYQLDFWILYTIANDSLFFLFILIFFYLIKTHRLNLIDLKVKAQKNKFSKSILVWGYGIVFANTCNYVFSLPIVFAVSVFYYCKSKQAKTETQQSHQPIQQTII